jgi:hypothetical protein
MTRTLLDVSYSPFAWTWTPRRLPHWLSLWGIMLVCGCTHFVDKTYVIPVERDDFRKPVHRVERDVYLPEPKPVQPYYPPVNPYVPDRRYREIPPIPAYPSPTGAMTPVLPSVALVALGLNQH